TVDALRAHGHTVRVLSRRPGPDHAVADLATGAGLAAALDGVETVVHLATSRSKDIGQTRMLLTAMAD
ncbi:epimerase, partial [Schumannella sp. 10F1B-5-1]